MVQALVQTAVPLSSTWPPRQTFIMPELPSKLPGISSLKRANRDLRGFSIRKGCLSSTLANRVWQEFDLSDRSNSLEEDELLMIIERLFERALEPPNQKSSIKSL